MSQVRPALVCKSAHKAGLSIKSSAGRIASFVSLLRTTRVLRQLPHPHFPHIIPVWCPFKWPGYS